MPDTISVVSVESLGLSMRQNENAGYDSLLQDGIGFWKSAYDVASPILGSGI